MHVFEELNMHRTHAGLDVCSFVHGQADGMGAWINDYAQKPLGKKTMQRETSTGLGCGFNYFYVHPYLRT